MNKKCTCGLDLDSEHWRYLYGFDGVCDECGQPHRYESIVGKYSRDIIYKGKLWHVYTLQSTLVCLGCGHGGLEIRVNCKNNKENYTSLFEKVEVPVEIKYDN